MRTIDLGENLTRRVNIVSAAMGMSSQELIKRSVEVTLAAIASQLPEIDMALKALSKLEAAVNERQPTIQPPRTEAISHL